MIILISIAVLQKKILNENVYYNIYWFYFEDLNIVYSVFYFKLKNNYLLTDSFNLILTK